MAEGIQIKNLPSTTTVKQGDTMTIVQDKQNKQFALDVFANESDLATLLPLENRCDEVKAKIEVDEYSAEITTSQSMSEIGSDDNGANLHENVLDGAYESCVLKGHTKYRDIDTGEILENFEESRNLELITVRMPILKTTGKNLFDGEFTIGSLSPNGFSEEKNRIRATNYISVEPLTTYTITSFEDFNIRYAVYYDKDKVAIGETAFNAQKIFTITTPKNTSYIIFNCAKTDVNSIFTESEIKNKKVQVEKGNVSTSFSGYHKSSILSFNQKDDKTIVLRSLPDGTCDTLNVETGEYVQKIGERNYQDGDTNSNTLVTDGTKTQYKLSSPITTKVDVQGFPHAYKNGHIQLSSGSTEPSLTPTVTYKVPVSRVGQIASNTKSNLRQTIKLDQLEILAYQSLINAEYENLLVQNSAESAASFTNLSTNDPKDELYYMLKHLIEEDQPVQNMLDKINLFYLYGLLSDEHYFDLLLGGEEDVY